MQKWNYRTKKYEEYTVPDSWKVNLYSTNIFEQINCASCGKSMIYGYGYISRTIYDENGFGYTVCYECYKKEIEEEQDYDRETKRFD